jgi:hypothetical protein
MAAIEPRLGPGPPTPEGARDHQPLLEHLSERAVQIDSRGRQRSRTALCSSRTTGA